MTYLLLFMYEFGIFVVVFIALIYLVHIYTNKRSLKSVIRLCFHTYSINWRRNLRVADYRFEVVHNVLWYVLQGSAIFLFISVVIIKCLQVIIAVQYYN
jgi:hypothetical protein